MVLHKSKWDKKATYLYLKKHGLATRPEKTDNSPRPKWSGKRKDAVDQRIVLQDSDDEWDSDTDNAFISHFYPQLGESQLTPEQRQKVKAQIIALLESEETNSDPPEPLVLDGIYLGKEPLHLTLESDGEDNKFDLAQFLVENKSKRRTLLKQRLLENLYEEYGIDSDNITRSGQADTAFMPKQTRRTLADILASELDGFHIGEVPLSELAAPKDHQSNVRILSQEETAHENARKELADRDALFREIKRKLTAKDASPRSLKVLELDNYNDADIGKLNSRLARGATAPQSQRSVLDFDKDLHTILGSHIPQVNGRENDDIDDLIARAKSSNSPLHADDSAAKPKYTRSTNDDSFLDNLLG